ncbi:MAG: bifunctional precorrin-2 dehydrogenase/sirohydrochlorin ferrochelatase [Gemmataceae bacterium]|nr:bifunctional precorrin-2 dehydrogenase/sirohydrochlorin ferrochelatase [Gemmataceae bacterium]MDW8265421.1 bifunctional precorrin-2 dehydrogenase/sirohydrochlorin ferrochelatase [Gemmataceae bacterium]
MLPLCVDMTGRLAVVVGGGAVGRRKALALAASAARVRVVCLEPKPSKPRWADIEWRCEEYGAAHLEGAALVVAAATPAVNAQVVADARARGLWVNAASDPSQGNVHFPATLRRGQLVVALATGGTVPALARHLRLRLERIFDEAVTSWIELLAELRPVIRDQVSDPTQRRRLWAELTRPQWLRHLRRQGADAVRTALLSHIAQAGGRADP